MAKICTGCAKDMALKGLVAKKGTPVRRCRICRSINVKALDADDKQLKTLIRALIRYYYAEADYNTHFGADGLESLFFKKNPITDYQESWPALAYEDALLPSIEDGYETEHVGISLFAGYGPNGEQNMLLPALNSELSWPLRSLKGRLASTNYFLLEADGVALLKPHLRKLKRLLPRGTSCFRARIGQANVATPQFGFGDEWHFEPFEGPALGAPPPPIATAGRLNRQGVAFLYLATDYETAISEVRPHPGDHVSFGEMRSCRRLKIADFNSISIADYAISDDTLNKFALLKSIDDLFSQPIGPSDRHHYNFTQFLSDLVRHLGFDGIGYKSSVGIGVNYAIFDPKAFTYTPGSAQVVRITQLQYTHERLRRLDPNEHYMTRPDGQYLQPA